MIVLIWNPNSTLHLSSGTLTRKSLKADLEKWSEQLFYAVPHNKQEIVELVGDSVDVFWEMRRYGEPWENVTPPESFFSSEKDSSEDMSGRSRHAFKSLVFDVTAEVLREMYKDEQEEDEVERAPWTRSCPPRRKYHKDPAPPTTLDELRPIVENNVLFYLGMADKDTPLVNRPHPRKWGSRKKKDCVDEILVQELREEEPGWVNYDKDEVAVKMQLADSLMDSLLLESATVMANIYSQRWYTASWWPSWSEGGNPANTKHLYNICTRLGQTLERRCTNLIQMFCVCWVVIIR